MSFFSCMFCHQEVQPVPPPANPPANPLEKPRVKYIDTKMINDANNDDRFNNYLIQAGIDLSPPR